MKFVTNQIKFFFQSKTAKRNVWVLSKFILVLIFLVLLYSYLFQLIMGLEGREYSWANSIYWTLVTMSTLGYGDITFHSEFGRIFSVLVIVSGVVFLLVMLPFTFIQFFYAPWLEAQKKARTPRDIPRETQNHVIITSFEAVSAALVNKLKQFGYKYIILSNDQQKALELIDQEYKIVLGDPDDITTYSRVNADHAALVFFNQDDQMNTNAIFTLRELTSRVPAVANAENQASIDIMQLAGADKVYHFTQMLGRSLARRVLGVSMHTNIIGKFKELTIAEAPAMRTPLEGKTIRESGIRENTGVNIVGIWQRGSFTIPRPETRIDTKTVLMLAGSEEQLQRYEQLYSVYSVSLQPVLILGGGRVGQAAAEALQENDVGYCIVDKNPRVARDNSGYVLGDAADLAVLKTAGIEQAPSVIITTNNDNMNIYLTIYCRRLRPDIQIITRATLDRSISKLHHAGADLVISYASMGANAVLNFLKEDKELMVAEGLNIFRQPLPPSLAGKSLQKSKIRENTNCSVIAVRMGQETNVNPEPDFILHKNQELILIGSAQAEKKFLEHFKQNKADTQA